MEKLTDSMINNALNNSDYATKGPWLGIVICGVLVCYLAFLCLMHTNLFKKIVCGLLALLIFSAGTYSITRDQSIKKSIRNDEWFVVVDTVKNVTYRTQSLNPYHLHLEEYGDVTLDGESEAKQYHSGEKVYVIVVLHGGEYVSTDVVFSMDTYKYVGNHPLK